MKKLISGALLLSLLFISGCSLQSSENKQWREQLSAYPGVAETSFVEKEFLVPYSPAVEVLVTPETDLEGLLKRACEVPAEPNTTLTIQMAGQTAPAHRVQQELKSTCSKEIIDLKKYFEALPDIPLTTNLELEVGIEQNNETARLKTYTTSSEDPTRTVSLVDFGTFLTNSSQLGEIMFYSANLSVEPVIMNYPNTVGDVIILEPGVTSSNERVALGKALTVVVDNGIQLSSIRVLEGEVQLIITSDQELIGASVFENITEAPIQVYVEN